MKWIIGLSLVFYILYLALNFTFVSIKVVRHDNIMQSASVYSTSENQSESPIFVIGDIALIRRDTVSLRAAAGTYQTNKSITPLPLIGLESITINLYRDHDVKKYSGDSLGCVAYDESTDRVLSYSCTDPRNLVHYDRPTDGTGIWENKLVATLSDGYPPIYSIKPFQQGILGIQQHPDSDKEFRNLVFTFDSNGTRKAYDLPPEIDRGDIPNLSLVVDMASASSDVFMIINTRTGDLYVGTLTNGTVTYHNSKVSDQYDSTHDALLCTLLGTTGYCYSGEPSQVYDSHARTVEKPRASTVEVIDFSTENPPKSVYTLSSEVGIDGIQLTQSKKLYARSQKEGTATDDIYAIQLKDNKATPQLILTNVSSTSFGDGLVYVQNNAIYKLDDEKNESYMVFSSKNLRISNVTPIGGRVFFTAFVNGVPDQKVHTYKLLDQTGSLPNGKRLVDILPFYMGSEMIDIDYVDNIVRVRVFASSITDKEHDRLLYDEGEYGANKATIENKLNSLGITSDKYEIIYSK